AVTAACLMTRRDVFDRAGGFDEGYSLTYNDVDYCLKLRVQGYVNVWTPLAELYHIESLTRGLDDTPEKQARCNSEAERFREKWGRELRAGDPYYNSNLSLHPSHFELRLNPPERPT